MTHALHLAAVYDLNVPADVAQRINVDGTRNVLDFVEGAPHLKRFGHVSTCAVSGDFEGTFTEDDFEKGQAFANHYEKTKYSAEKMVRERRDTLPTVIFRPGYVVGDSRTGAFEKLDGPYFALRIIARNLHWLVPSAPDTFCNAPPVDYVADACVCLLADEDSTGRVFHLTDPDPLTYNEFFDAACEAWGKSRPLAHVPMWLLKPLFRLPPVAKAYGLPYYVLVYAGIHVHYDTRRAVAALERHGIRCPHASEYLDTLIAWFKAHYRDGDIRKGQIYKEVAP
jgi:nucleoside-diphosphate-sugar epimerase